MPIQFRCHHCRQVLSISSKKAGTLVPCPSCREETRVPTMEEVHAALSAQKKKPDAPRKEGEGEAVSAGERPAAAAVARVPLPSETAGGPAPHEEGYELWAAAARERNPWLDETADAEEEFHLHRPPMDEGGLDMTPMVDVTFLLLIFFMITAAFNLQKSLPADPPQPEQEGAAQTTVIQELESDTITVGISENDELTLDDEPIGGLGALADALAARAASGTGGELEMTIEADPRCTFGILVGVMDVGISAGMQRIKRVSRPLEE